MKPPLILSSVLNYAPNIAGTLYTIGNLILLLNGGLHGSWWQVAAALFWLADGVILGWFGRLARGIEIHAMINMTGCLCLIMASRDLAQPFGQVAFASILMFGAILKIIAPSADQAIAKPKNILAWPWYLLRRYPMSVVASIAFASRPFFIWGAIVNDQPQLLSAGILWVIADIFQFLSRKGGYIKE